MIPLYSPHNNYAAARRPLVAGALSDGAVWQPGVEEAV